MAKEAQFSDKVKFIPLGDIHWDKRYREEMGEIEELAESIKEKGLLQPITVSTELLLLAGHRRVLAARKVGLDRVPALIRRVDGELDMREIELMENVFRKNFTWHEEAALIQEIDRLYRDKYKGAPDPWNQRRTAQLLAKSLASVSRAIQLAEYSAAMPELREVKTADEAFKLVKKFEEEAVITELRKRQEVQSEKRGLDDVIRVAKANYRIGDVFEGLAQLRDNTLIDVIECDPPYGISLKEQKRSKDSVTSTVHTYDEITGTEYPGFLGALTKELYRVAGKNCWLLFWFGPTWHTEVKRALEVAGWEVDDIPAIWIKPTGQTMSPELYLARAYEPFFICRKGNPVLMKRGRSNVFQYSPTPSQDKYHTTERPLPLMEEILTTFGVDLQTVLIPFLGSGVTLRAVYKLGMKGFGWEVSDKYKDRFLLAVEADTKEMDKGE